MIIPKLTPVEYLIEEGRMTAVIIATTALIATCALTVALFVFPSVRDVLVDRLTTIIEIAIPLASGVTAFKTWMKTKAPTPIAVEGSAPMAATPTSG